MLVRQRLTRHLQVDRVMLQEAFELGERVRKWTVEVHTRAGWAPMANGTAMGAFWMAK